MDDALPPTQRHAFAPGPGLERAFRDALGLYPTGVTIITTQTPQGLVGITANSFSSLSLDPPLVLWSPARASRRFEVFAKAQQFSIYILGQEQGDLCSHFTRDGAEPAPGATATTLHDALVRLDCRLHASHDGGDHLLIIGRVEQVEMRQGAPLAFHAGKLAQVAPS
jgi:flavin reductase (DIM6/NTAB) family NADH-FMN oxidoreductase RutF